MYHLGIIKFVIFLSLFQCSGKNMNKSTKDKPNLLIIQTDEHNFRTLGCYREHLSNDQAYVWGEGNNVETPNLDYLAHNGTMFTKFYASAPVCSPSRSSMVSGLYPQHTGVTHNDLPMKDEVVTYAKVLADNGYKTGFIGKWHLNGEGKPEWDPERNFGFEDNRYMVNRGHWKKIEDSDEGPKITSNKKGEPTYNLDGADEKTYTTDYLTDKAIDFIDNNKKQPFLLHLSFPDPHNPDRVRSPYNTMYSNLEYEAPKTNHVEEAKAPGWAKPEEKGELIDQSQYFGMVKCIDDNVGEIVNYLRKENLLDNTVIVFISDHGDLRAEHHRQNKGNPFEASAKVPFIVYYPKEIPAGSVVNNAFNMVDFAPTFLSFLNQDIPSVMEGRNFSELLRKPQNQDKWEDITFMRASGGNKNGSWIAAATSRYKLVLSKYDKPWLLDLKEDPDELINFIDDAGKADVVKELAKKLSEYAEKHSDPYLNGTKLAKDLNALLK